MTDRQRKLLDYLCSIALDPNLEITFVNSSSGGLSGDKKAYCKVVDGKVKLYLDEPISDEDLQQWEVAILYADKRLLDLKAQEKWEELHPNYYDAVIAKLKNLKKYKK